MHSRCSCHLWRCLHSTMSVLLDSPSSCCRCHDCYWCHQCLQLSSQWYHSHQLCWSLSIMLIDCWLTRNVDDICRRFCLVNFCRSASLHYWRWCYFHFASNRHPIRSHHCDTFDRCFAVEVFDFVVGRPMLPLVWMIHYRCIVIVLNRCDSSSHSRCQDRNAVLSSTGIKQGSG